MAIPKQRYEHSYTCHLAWMRRLDMGRGKDDRCTEDCPHYKPNPPPMIRKPTTQTKSKQELQVDYDNEVFGWIDDFVDDAQN